ncbi:MAG: phage tail protein [Planctomycetaceae bacterium]|nr:phage tail protein [Planctomycetaceae bacterium]MCB9951249.1 phage tail protein [Planctomycetaceae bacterium]
MSDPFIAEIRIFAGNFAPRGWSFCDGQTLPIAQNTALFSLLGTTYGGDGRTNFKLPDLQGSAPIHSGRGPGLTDRRLGEKGGAENVTLTVAQMPGHKHTATVSLQPGADDDPTGNYLGGGGVAATLLYAANTAPANSDLAALPNSGGNVAHNNMMPYLSLNFIIALVGLYPSRG